MLASAMVNPVTGAAFDARYGDGWLLEKKLNGHRVHVRVSGTDVLATSLSRSSSKPGKVRTLPPAIVTVMRSLGDGDYDGELVATTDKAWNVTKKGSELVYVIFDLLSHRGVSYTRQTYAFRRARLLEVLRPLLDTDQSVVTTVTSERPRWQDVVAIWDGDGEGAVLKLANSIYQEGRRSPDWVKVKRGGVAVLPIVGFKAGKSGPYSAFRLRDAHGRPATVKVLWQSMRDEIAAKPEAFLGRQVVIAYQEITPAGHYLNGHFDHFAGPGEVQPRTEDSMAKKKTTAKKATAAKKPAPKKALTKKKTTFAQVRRKVEAALAPPAPPVPPPAPPAPPVPPPAPSAQAWRAGIDWVAAGKKAYETRMRNLAAKAAAANGVVVGPGAKLPDPMTNTAARRGPLVQPAPIAAPRSKRKAPAKPTAPLTEGDTSRS